MALQEIGKVKSGSGKEYQVYWDTSDKKVYVGYAGRTHIGSASNASEAANKAEVWLRNK